MLKNIFKGGSWNNVKFLLGIFKNVSKDIGPETRNGLQLKSNKTRIEKGFC